MRFARVVSAFDQHNPDIDRLVETADLDVLQLDYRWPNLCPDGVNYAPGLLHQLRTLHKTLYLDPSLHLITDAGGGDPLGCAEAIGQFLCEHGDAEMPLTTIRGDNVLPQLEELMAEGIELRDFDTGMTVQEMTQPLLAAQVELGAGPLETALNEGSRFVIAGCYDISAPAIATAVSALRWSWEQVDKLAPLAVAAQLPETLLDMDVENDLTIRGYCGKTIDALSLPADVLLAATNKGLIRCADVNCQITDFELQEPSPDVFAIAGVTGHSTAGQWLLRMAYQTGYCAEGLLSCSDTETSKQAADQLHQLLNVEKNEHRTVKIDNLSLDDSKTRGLVLVRCQSLEREPCVEFVSELTSFPAQSKLQDCEFSGCLPVWQPKIAQLHCPVPREAIAVSVDTRPAKEWR